MDFFYKILAKKETAQQPWIELAVLPIKRLKRVKIADV